MHREALFDSLRAALLAQDAERVRALAHDNHPADLAEALRDLDPDTATRTLAALPADMRAELFGYLAPEQQLDLAERLDRSRLAELFLHMSADERADLYNALDEDRRELLMPGLAQAEREDIRKLASYPEGAAGSVMTSDYAVIPAGASAAQAIERLRAEAPDKETIYDAYLVDGERRLVGVVSLRDLILAPPATPVTRIMKRDVVTIRADDPREQAARVVRDYDLLAVPVINGGDKLVGIITYDDAMDVAEAEATEDFHRSGGVGALSTSVRDASLAMLYRTRVFWLVLLVFGNLFSGAGIAHYEDTIADHLTLLFFLPLLIASAGNAGSQASTLMVRAMATGEVELRDWGRMLGREFVVAALLGVTMAIAIAGIGVWRGGQAVAEVVAITMILVVIVGSLIGMSLPFVLSRMRLDPATASGPLVTSIADVAGVMIYFGIATALLMPGSPA